MTTVYEKVKEFLKDRKGSFTVKQIANYFSVSETPVYFACRHLVSIGVAVRTKQTVPNTGYRNPQAFFYQHKSNVDERDDDEMQESVINTVLENVTVTWQFKGHDIVSKNFDTFENATEYLAETRLGEHQNIKALVVTANKRQETRLTLRLI